MCKRPVGVGHAVRVFLLLDRVALALGRGDQFRGEALVDRLLAALAGVLDQRAHRQCRTTLRTHFDRHLVRGAADSAALHLDDRLRVFAACLNTVTPGCRFARRSGRSRCRRRRSAGPSSSYMSAFTDSTRSGCRSAGRRVRALDGTSPSAHFLPPAGQPWALAPYFERLRRRW